MDKWTELDREERKLQAKEEDVSKAQRQVERIQEAYAHHLSEARHFLEENCYLFHKNEKRHIYESAMEALSNESYQIMVHLEDNHHEMEVKKRNIQQMLDDIIYEKRKVSEQEEENEY